MKKEEIEWLDQLNNVVKENLQDPLLSNVSLANHLGISERKLYRKVKLLLDQTPNRYIRQLKLQKAHELLQSGQYTKVKEVVPMVGFIKVKYFYRIFKEQYGYPPGKVLRNKKTTEEWSNAML